MRDALVRFLVGDRADKSGLRIIPSNFSKTCTLSGLTLTSVCPDDQLGSECFSRAQCDRSMMWFDLVLFDACSGLISNPGCAL